MHPLTPKPRRFSVHSGLKRLCPPSTDPRRPNQFHSGAINCRRPAIKAPGREKSVRIRNFDLSISGQALDNLIQVIAEAKAQRRHPTLASVEA